jgi:eukaryotic-like serine/threonine-protein kinase
MKILSPEHAARPGAIRRLFSEARAVNQISHPHIVEVTDLIEAEGPRGVNAIVMELLEGKSLAQAMSEAKHMPPDRFLGILAQVADALAAAHAARFVHRDLKPENIFLTTKNGRADYVKLLDFGLAKTTGEDETTTPTPSVRPRSHGTAEGIFVGTPAYASPEQASGKPVDYRTDIYSLGVILYELLCGRLPFEGRNFGEYVVKHLTQPPPPAPPEVMRSPLGRCIDAVARRCLAKDPTDRFFSAAGLREGFERLAAGETTASELRGSAIGEVVASLRASARKSWLMGAGLVVVAVAFGVVMFWSPRGPTSMRASVNVAAPAPRPAQIRPPQIVPLVPDKTVELRFQSQPPGAATRRLADGELLGITPFTRTEAATGRAVEYEMQLPGHAPRRDKVVLDAAAGSRDVGGVLHRLPATRRGTGRSAASGGGGGRPKKSSQNATLNPFSR